MFSLQKTPARKMCIAHVSIVTKEYLGFPSDYDFRTVFKLLHYCSINLNCCVRICEYFIPNGQLWKIWTETVLTELCSFFIDILAFDLGKLCPGVFRYFDPGAGVLH